MHDDLTDEWQAQSVLPEATALDPADDLILDPTPFPLTGLDSTGALPDLSAPEYVEAAPRAQVSAGSDVGPFARTEHLGFTGYSHCGNGCPCQGFVGYGQQCDNCGHKFSDHY